MFTPGAAFTWEAGALALQTGHVATAMLLAHREVIAPEAAEAHWQIAPLTTDVNS